MQKKDLNADVFRAIADPTRRSLLDLLRHDEYPALKLAERFQLSQPAISQHLKVLRQAGLVRERREGRLRIYELEARPLLAVADWIAHYEQFWRNKLSALEDHLREKHGSESKD